MTPAPVDLAYSTLDQRHDREVLAGFVALRTGVQQTEPVGQIPGRPKCTGRCRGPKGNAGLGTTGMAGRRSPMTPGQIGAHVADAHRITRRDRPGEGGGKSAVIAWEVMAGTMEFFVVKGLCQESTCLRTLWWLRTPPGPQMRCREWPACRPPSSVAPSVRRS